MEVTFVVRRDTSTCPLFAIRCQCTGAAGARANETSASHCGRPEGLGLLTLHPESEVSNLGAFSLCYGWGAQPAGLCALSGFSSFPAKLSDGHDAWRLCIACSAHRGPGPALDPKKAYQYKRLDGYSELQSP